MSDIEDAEALFEQARQAAADERYGDAIAGFREFVERFGERPDDALDGLVGDALYGIGYSLERIEREEEALPLYEQVVVRLGDADQFRGPVARALFHQGSVHSHMGRAEEAIAVWDQLIGRFGDTLEPPVGGWVASALERKAAALRRLERLDDAVDAYDLLIVRFTDSQFPPLRKQADVALSNKVFVRLLQGRHDEAIIVADAAVERLTNADDPSALAIAVLNLGGALAREQRFAEAVSVYDALIERLDSADAPDLRSDLILAVSNKVEVLMMVGRTEDAVAVHNELLERFGGEVAKTFADAAARNEHDEGAVAVVAGMLLKEALVLAELERLDEALIAANNLIDRFTDKGGDEMERILEMARALREQLSAGD
jgi:tetratricopeptide (TPR) repeat protein